MGREHSDETVERWPGPWPLSVGEAAERHGCQDEDVVPLSQAEAALARVEAEAKMWETLAEERLEIAEGHLARAEKAEAKRDEARAETKKAARGWHDNADALHQALSRIEAVRERIQTLKNLQDGEENSITYMGDDLLSLLDKKEGTESPEDREDGLRGALQGLYDFLPRGSCKSDRPDGCPVCVARAVLAESSPRKPSKEAMEFARKYEASRRSPEDRDGLSEGGEPRNAHEQRMGRSGWQDTLIALLAEFDYGLSEGVPAGRSALGRVRHPDPLAESDPQKHWADESTQDRADRAVAESDPSSPRPEQECTCEGPNACSGTDSHDANCGGACGTLAPIPEERHATYGGTNG